MVKNNVSTSSPKCYWLLLLLAFLSTQPGARAFVSPKNTVIFQQNGRRDYNHVAPSISTEGQHLEKYEVAAKSLSAVSVSGGGEEASRLERLSKFASKNFFVLGMFAAVTMAKCAPKLGVNGGLLRPELIIGKYGVTVIFLLSGLSLEVSELKHAIGNMKLNALIQSILFLAWPFLVGLPLVGLLGKVIPSITGSSLLPKPLLDGLLILTCLPTTVNMCIFLTSASGGSVASALCNAALGNLLGIFATPALLFKFFGASIEVPFVDMVIKLCSKVLLPVSVGQMLRSTKAKNVYDKHSKLFKRLQEIILLGIVWNAFCNAFVKGFGLDVTNVILLLTVLPTIHLASLLGLFKFFQWKPFGFSKGEVVAAAYTASHKTLAFGLPLVNTVFAGNPNLASYCAPIMFIHPLQLVLGSLMVPYFANFMLDNE
mmetsp:Transcript_10200/g.15207  ORF Transcript_10200/g.15207 Transcript_10200/m.15207 type:complete len:428 (-) Transcript_10200:263-1546(-)|eukprot:CAMPEP_0196808104 /NCGR_PEP_ID=MMETSP1362-20130617/8086_1 /TAXON_ID=163516 /ORGANISM="Leptocylindrus danicus, Strain CCMP1856" /LENGTH=427 /DNA_ID=CAMNT_0042182295 /DNA_START=120 /DNA_END=1403 /DNA_ORIENTATION=+